MIDMTSIKNTDIESEKKRGWIEEHLKNEDFFDVENFPTSKLVISVIFTFLSKNENRPWECHIWIPRKILVWVDNCSSKTGVSEAIS